MGAVAIRKATWDGATPLQRRVARTLLDAFVELGQPVEGDLGGVAYYVFDDSRIDRELVEKLGFLLSIVATLSTEPKIAGRDYQLSEVQDVEVPVYEWQDLPLLDELGNPILDPDTGEPLTYRAQVATGQTQIVQMEVSLGDPLTLAAQASDAGAWFKAASGVPAGFTPTGV